MIVYCDTSFLVSFLNEDDINHQAARDASKRWDSHDFVVCALHLVELPAAVRAAIHRTDSPVPRHIARRVINRFDRAVTGGLLIRRDLPMMDAVGMARTLGDAHGWDRRHPAFDLWHLGAAWALAAGVFLSFDARQSKLAKTLGMATV